MKQFVANRSGAVPTLDVVNETKVKVYTNEAAIDADLANLEVGQIVSDKFKLYRKTATGKDLITGLGYGMPLGAVVELEDNVNVPDGYLLCDGSTFDETVYPALYAYLGSNVLPVKKTEELDWDNLTQMTLTASTSYTVAEDGYINVGWGGVVGNYTVSVNGEVICSVYGVANAWADSNYNIVRVGPGDVVTCTSQPSKRDFIPLKNSTHTFIKATPAGSGDISDVGALIRKANPDWIVLNASVTSGYEIPGLLDAIDDGAIGFELLFAPYSETPTAYVTEKCIKIAGLTTQAFRLDANAAYGMNVTSIDWTTGVLSGNYVNIYAWRPIYGVIA